MHDAAALGGEEDEDGEEEAEEREGGYVFEEHGIVPFFACEFSENEPGDDGSGEGDTEEDGDAGRDDGVRDLVRRYGAVVADDADEEHRQRRIQHHLQQRVHGDEKSAVFFVAAREPRPHEHHGNAPRQPDQHDPLSQTALIRQKRPRQSQHQARRDEPVDDDGEGELDADLAGGVGAVEGLEADFAEDGVHHYEEAEGEREGDVGEVAALEGRGCGGDEVGEEDAGGHCEEDPEG